MTRTKRLIVTLAIPAAIGATAGPVAAMTASAAPVVAAATATGPVQPDSFYHA